MFSAATLLQQVLEHAAPEPLNETATAPASSTLEVGAEPFITLDELIGVSVQSVCNDKPVYHLAYHCCPVV